MLGYFDTETSGSIKKLKMKKNFTLQQDNTPKHTFVSTNEWFQATEDQSLEMTQSTGLSPIENVEWLRESYADDIAWHCDGATFFATNSRTNVPGMQIWDLDKETYHNVLGGG